MEMDARLVRRVVLRNYKSIAACDVSPGQLTFLVGPNGSGKSNVLDALRFLSDSLRHSLDHALRDRGGIKEVRRRSRGRPTHFGMRVEFDVGSATGHLAFTVAAQEGGGYELKKEECVVVPKDPSPSDPPAVFYRIASGGVVESFFDPFPTPSPHRLALESASGWYPEFRAVHDAFSRCGFYNLNPAAIRSVQPPNSGDLMEGDGSNVASVLHRIARRSPDAKTLIEEYLAKVVPGIKGVDRKAVGHLETLEFRQRVAGAPNEWRYHAGSMSDGTLRTVGLLVALFQNDGEPQSLSQQIGTERSLVGVEEPELALHPAAAAVIVDALRDAAARRQVIVTSHSADMLDEEEIDGACVLAVVSDGGITRIGPLDDVGASVLRDRLFTAGELLRMDKLGPDSSLSKRAVRVSDLFGSSGGRSGSR